MVSNDWTPVPGPTPIPSALHQRPPRLSIGVGDPKSVAWLIGQVIERSGLSQAEIAKRLGITRQTVNQAVLARRRPTLQWFAKLAGVCGAVVVVEFQDSGVS